MWRNFSAKREAEMYHAPGKTELKKRGCQQYSVSPKFRNLKAARAGGRDRAQDGWPAVQVYGGAADAENATYN